MPSRLQKLLAEVQATITDVPNLVWGFGVRDITLQKRPPRVVWVPSQDGHFAPDPDFTNPRAIATRRAGVDAHCWGKDHEETEALADRILVALDDRCGSSLRLSTGNWVTQQAQEAGYITLGEVYILPVTIDMPVFQPPWAETRVSDVRFVGPDAVQGDGILTSGEE